MLPIAETVEGTYTIGVNQKEWQVSTSELARFAALFIRNSDIRSRTSRLLQLDLFVCSREFGINPAAVVQEMEYLEGIGRGSRGTKEAAPFTRKPLAGLWHKHFFCGRFMARNIQTGLANGRLRGIIEEAVEEINRTVFTDEIPVEVAEALSRKVASRCVDETLKLRRNRLAITGEWIIYAKYNNKNYYLSLGSHQHGDQNIKDRIEKFCPQDFPFISQIFI